VLGLGGESGWIAFCILLSGILYSGFNKYMSGHSHASCCGPDGRSLTSTPLCFDASTEIRSQWALASMCCPACSTMHRSAANETNKSYDLHAAF
jgi:hypothetical protein